MKHRSRTAVVPPFDSTTNQITLREIRLPTACVFRREPYVIGTIITGATEAGEIPFSTIPVRGVKRGKHAIFGPPVILAEADDFRGHVSGELFLMDSDEDFRALGPFMLSVRDEIKWGSSLGQLIAAGTPGLAAARDALRPAFDMLESSLSETNDDLLGRFELQLDADDGYRGGEVITLENSRCEIEIGVNIGSTQE